MTDKESEYTFPLRTKNIEIFQGRNGRFSHDSKGKLDTTNAVDFAAKPGTPVVAARSGRVLTYQDSSDTCYRGLDRNVGERFGRDANFVLIDHGGGQLSAYVHLEKGSVRVTEGQQVEEGYEIAKTGRSGWVGPVDHLHFQVYQQDGPQNKSVPVRISGYNGPLEDSKIKR